MGQRIAAPFAARGKNGVTGKYPQRRRPLSHSEKGNGRLRVCLVEMPPHGRGRDKFLRHGMAAGPTNCGMGQKNGSGRSASRHRSRREESFAGKFMILKIVNLGFAIVLCAIAKLSVYFY
jgi:hypothetical protein